MKKIILIILIFSSAVVNAQTKKTTTAKKTVTTQSAPAAPKVSIDSFSYALGVNIASNLRTQGITNINNASLQRAMADVFTNKTPLLTENQCKMAIQDKLMKYMSNKNSAAKEEGTKFLAENKKRPGVVELPNGLQYEIIKQGTGQKPKLTDTVKAHYAGSLINGQEFDNSYKRGEPLQIPVSGVIPGWTQALQMMPVGSKWKLYIPSDLGYGDRGAGGAIPGGATLIFDIELIEIVHSK
jgi:FKBP-type peptidyl-prolyl cis-trans isomerase FklB